MAGLMDWSKPLKPKATYANSMTFLPPQGLTVDGNSLNSFDVNAQMPTGYGTQIPSLSLGTPTLVAPGTGFMDAGYNPTAGLELTKRLPDAKGGWMDYGKMGLDVLKVGTGIWNASMQNDQNKFMRQTTNEQMARQKTDFNNSVLAYNSEASAREGRRISGAQGIAYDDPRNAAGRADYMKTWGASNIA